MNSQEQMGIYKEMEQKGWLNSADLFRTKDTGVYGRMYRLIDEYNNSNGQRGLLNTPESRNAYLREAEMRNTDWFAESFRQRHRRNGKIILLCLVERYARSGLVQAEQSEALHSQCKHHL